MYIDYMYTYCMFPSTCLRAKVQSTFHCYSKTEAKQSEKQVGMGAMRPLAAPMCEE